MSNLRQSVANKPGRGGKRPGAGAPHGNLNALKHGRNSSHVQALIQALAAHPTTRDVLIRLARRQRAAKRQAARTANLLFRELLNRALISLKDNQTEEQAANTDRILDAVLYRNNQPPDTPAPNQSNP